MNPVIHVRELLAALLPTPKKRIDVLEVDRAESLKELGLIIDGYEVC